MSTDHKQQAKRMAGRLRTSLAERGVEVTHSEALELVAHQHGARDWNTLAAAHAEVVPPRAGGFGPVIPVLRIFDVDKAREFYTDFLGFGDDWEHTFDDHAPVYLQASRGGAVLHLSEHHGDASPGATARVIVDDVHGLHAELHQRDYRYAKPGLEQLPWGREVTVLDPFANRIVFHQPAEDDAEHPEGGGEAAGPIEHAYDVACSPEHAFGVFTAEIGTWWPDGYSPPGKQDVLIEPGIGGACTMLLADGFGVPLGHRHRVAAGPLRDGLHPGAGPRPPEPDRRAVRRRRRGHADALQPRRLDGRERGGPGAVQRVADHPGPLRRQGGGPAAC